MSSSQAKSLKIPILYPRAVFGLKTTFPGNVECINDDQIIYPVGGMLTIHNPMQQCQKFIKLPQKGVNVNAMTVSPNKRIIAVAERGGRPTITLYDVNTYKKKRQIQIPSERDVTAQEFIAMCFTCDSKCIVTVTGEPDWDMYVFKCDKGKIHSSTRALNPNGTGTVSIVTCNPIDVNMLVLVGNQLLRILACSDFVWRQHGYSKSENMNFTACAWLSPDRIFFGTNEGKVLIVENGIPKAAFWAGDMPAIAFNLKEEQRFSQTSLSVLGSLPLLEDEDNEIRSVVAFERGFAFVYLTGTIHLYEKIDPNRYTKRNVFKLPTVAVKGKPSQDKTTTNKINCIRITPSEDRLIVTCSQSQIYTTKLWGRDMNTAPEIECVPWGPTLHYGRIGGLSTCIWKPLFMTSGLDDRSLRLWNYEQETLELYKEFHEDIFGISIHPTGLFAVVGFSSRLRFLTITIDNLIKTREFNVKCCKLCSFSKLGHLFAGTNGNMIQVYSTVSFEQLHVLKGHTGLITSISWSQNDNKMATCGRDGAVYEWAVSTATKVSAVVIKTCEFTSAVVASDGETIYAVGTDGYIREMKKGAVARQLMFLPNGVDCLILSNLNTMLFASGNQGTIYSIGFPFIDFLKYYDYFVHYTTVHHMQISYDDRYVITCAESGVICIWRLMNTEGKAIKLPPNLHRTSEILIPQQNLEYTIVQIKELKGKIQELLTEHDFEMRENDNMHNVKLKDVHEGYVNAMDELKERNEQMEGDHMQEISNISVEIDSMKATHEELVQKLEFSYKEKLINQDDRYLRLEEEIAEMRIKYEKQLEKLTNEKKETETFLTNHYVEQLKEAQVEYEDFLEKAQKSANEQELMKQRIEDDADREIYELKTGNMQEIKDEEDLHSQLRNEAGILKKNYITSQKEIDSFKRALSGMENEHVKLKGAIMDLEKNISDLKKEIIERDTTIQEKEERIFELKSKNQDLEKFKYILEFKLQELQLQIEPREKLIKDQTKQIDDMAKEFDNLQKIVTNLDLQLTELREKLSAASNEYKREMANSIAMKTTFRKFRTDIQFAIALVEDVPRLKRLLKEMYHKYNADRDFAATQAEDAKSKNKFLRQRDFLEKTSKTLRQQVKKSSVAGGSNRKRLVEENAALTSKTNALRMDLKIQQREYKKMKSVMGIGSKFLFPKDAQKKLAEAISVKDEIHRKYKEKLKENEIRMKALKDDNKRLVGEVIGANEEVQSQILSQAEQISYSVRSTDGDDKDQSN